MGYNLNILNNTYYNVQGIKVKGQNNNDNIYLPAKVQTLSALSNGFYIPPDDETVYKAIVANVSDATPAYDLSTWQGLFKLAETGYANFVLEIGGEISGTYTVGETVYNYPWIVMDFQDVETEDETIHKNVPILQAKYTGHEILAFDAAEPTNPDATIKSSGRCRWPYSYARQYMNSSGTGWWVATSEYDVPYSTTQTGFMSYLDYELTARLYPIKIKTTVAWSGADTGGPDFSYDKLWLPGVSQLNGVVSGSSGNDGTAWQYYKDALQSDVPVVAERTNYYQAWIRRVVNSNNTAVSYLLRSTDIKNAQNKPYMRDEGNIWWSYPPRSTTTNPRVLPCCALIGNTDDIV